MLLWWLLLISFAGVDIPKIALGIIHVGSDSHLFQRISADLPSSYIVCSCTKTSFTYLQTGNRALPILAKLIEPLLAIEVQVLHWSRPSSLQQFGFAWANFILQHVVLRFRYIPLRFCRCLFQVSTISHCWHISILDIFYVAFSIFLFVNDYISLTATVWYCCHNVFRRSIKFNHGIKQENQEQFGSIKIHSGPLEQVMINWCDENVGQVGAYIFRWNSTGTKSEVYLHGPSKSLSSISRFWSLV